MKKCRDLFERERTKRKKDNAKEEQTKGVMVYLLFLYINIRRREMKDASYQKFVGNMTLEIYYFFRIEFLLNRAYVTG